MALKVIGAGLGRTGTMSFKLAMDYLGLGPCFHMSEVFADVHRQLPLWIDVMAGNPDWDAIFESFPSCNDHPASNHWRELADHWPEARVVLTTRSPESWAHSVRTTIYNPSNFAAMPQGPMKTFLTEHILGELRDHIDDPDWMADWYRRREAEVIAAIAPERLLVLPIGTGWEPLCAFLGVAVPDVPYPRVNSASEWYEAFHRPPPPGTPEGLDGVAAMGRGMIAAMRAQAFGA